MQNWLKIKTAGLPRWAWIALLGGGVALGLYLRSRNSGEAEGEEGYTEGGELVEGGTGGYGEGGMAGAGLIGSAGGSTSVPVSTPYIPDAFTSMFESLTALVGQQGESLGDIAAWIAEHPTQIIEREISGGGAPDAGNHYAPPEGSAPAGTQTKPAPPQCPANVRAAINNRNDKIQAANHAIDGLQTKVKNLTANIQAHPNAKNRNQWVNERNQAQAQIQSSRANAQQWQAEVAKLKKTPGCS